MKFIVDNIIWFIIGGVVILMTIVGYMAEKTDFASKKYREKVGHKKNDNKQKENIVKEKELDEPDNSSKESAVVVEEPVIETAANNDKIEDIPEELFAPIENIPKTESISVEESNNNSDKIEDIPEELFAPIESDSKTEENVEMMSEDTPVETLEVEEPVETLQDETIVNEGPVEKLDNDTSNLEDTKDDSQGTDVNNLYNSSFEFENFEPVEAEQKIGDTGYINEGLAENQPVESLNMEINNNNETATEIPTETLMTNDTATEISNEEADKIFPDDPVVINDNNLTTDNTQNSNVDVLQEMPSLSSEQPKTAEAEPEDLWKF